MNASATASAKARAYDAILVDRFKGGDESAFDEIVVRYRGKLFSLIHMRLRNNSDSEEVTQDALIRAYRGLPNFRGDSALYTWLCHIAINLARNRYWYWWRRKATAHVSFDAVVNETSGITLAEVIPAQQEDAPSLLERSQFVDAIARGMELLGTKQREILVLRNVMNYEYDEIATALGINVGTVKSRIARARASLRSKLPEELR